ncbi:MAG: hypothetical protein LBS90_02590 [Oscillospiraceae bacterium]|jgi:hypothetical protein|nr:hypothetical protein [Oscillospiraceae bacterium]
MKKRVITIFAALGSEVLDIVLLCAMLQTGLDVVEPAMFVATAVFVIGIPPLLIAYLYELRRGRDVPKRFGFVRWMLRFACFTSISTGIAAIERNMNFEFRAPSDWLFGISPGRLVVLSFAAIVPVALLAVKIERRIAARRGSSAKSRARGDTTDTK